MAEVPWSVSAVGVAFLHCAAGGGRSARTGSGESEACRRCRRRCVFRTPPCLRAAARRRARTSVRLVSRGGARAKARQSAIIAHCTSASPQALELSLQPSMSDGSSPMRRGLRSRRPSCRSRSRSFRRLPRQPKSSCFITPAPTPNTRRDRPHTMPLLVAITV